MPKRVRHDEKENRHADAYRHPTRSVTRMAFTHHTGCRNELGMTKKKTVMPMHICIHAFGDEDGVHLSYGVPKGVRHAEGVKKYA